MQPSLKLPRNVYYEEKRDRYRVRIYRNKRAYLEYYDTEPAALEGLRVMRERLSAVPSRRKKRNAPLEVPALTFSSLIKALTD